MGYFNSSIFKTMIKYSGPLYFKCGRTQSIIGAHESDINSPNLKKDPSFCHDCWESNHLAADRRLVVGGHLLHLSTPLGF